jgi:hypothetical protein
LLFTQIRAFGRIGNIVFFHIASVLLSGNLMTAKLSANLPNVLSI